MAAGEIFPQPAALPPGCSPRCRAGVLACLKVPAGIRVSFILDSSEWHQTCNQVQTRGASQGRLSNRQPGREPVGQEVRWISTVKPETSREWSEGFYCGPFFGASRAGSVAGLQPVLA